MTSRSELHIELFSRAGCQQNILFGHVSKTFRFVMSAKHFVLSGQQNILFGHVSKTFRLVMSAKHFVWSSLPTKNFDFQGSRYPARFGGFLFPVLHTTYTLICENQKCGTASPAKATALRHTNTTATQMPPCARISKTCATLCAGHSEWRTFLSRERQLGNYATSW